MKLNKKTEELLVKLNAENGPVYEKQDDLEVIELEDDQITLNKSQFGYYLSITLKDKSKRMVNIKGFAPTDDIAKLPEKYQLELHEAIRELPAQGNRRAIPKGAQKVFAVAA